MYAARWIAVLAAFAGLLIVVWPGLMSADIDSLPSLGLLAASPLMAGSFLISKVLTRYERPEAIVFWLGIMIGLGTLPVALLDWHWPTPAQWGLLAACGVIGSSAHYCMTRSYRIADVGTVQSVRFLDLLWASLFGFLVFAHAPTIWTLAGGSLICAATIWIARHEARRRPAAAP
jgi:drug/metabolite transporter (DMT)-like permease